VGVTGDDSILGDLISMCFGFCDDRFLRLLVIVISSTRLI
jgi:hypothetical protein